MVFPVIQFLFPRRGERLSDIEYLAIKEFGGQLVKNNSAGQTATGDGATLTASSGKDMYVARAYAQVGFQSGTSASATVVLKVNGTIVDSVTLRPAGSSTVHSQPKHEFMIGFKCATAQIIKLEVTAESGAFIDTGLECIEEDTGASPAV